MVKQNYRVVMSSDANRSAEDYLEHRSLGQMFQKREPKNTTISGLFAAGKKNRLPMPSLNPAKITEKATEAANTVADLLSTLGVTDSKNMDSAKKSMAKRFADTKINELAKDHRLTDSDVRTFRNAYLRALDGLGYNLTRDLW